MYVYYYSRHYAEGQAKFDTLVEAVERAWADLEYDCAWSIRVEKDGEVILGSETLHKIVSDMQVWPPQ